MSPTNDLDYTSNMKSFFVFIVLLLFISSFFTPQTNAASPIASLPLISRSIPAYSSDDCFANYPASRANDADYSTQWRSCAAQPSSGSPVTISYDLSGIASDSRKNVVLAWYNDPTTSPYDHTIILPTFAYNMPANYTIQANSAAGGSLPGSGWVTLVTVTGNVFHSRQHVLNLEGYNWIRMSVTATDGAVANFDVSLNMDIHNSSSGVIDNWLFLGDSVTQYGLQHDSTHGNTFGQLVNASNNTYYPLQENGGIAGASSTNAVASISAWLTNFPGKFVVLNYGTNDANLAGAGDPTIGTTFYNNLLSLVNTIETAGKIAIIPHIIYGKTTNILSNAPTLNTKIDQLYTDHPSIIRGPDLWSYFNTNESYISGDNIHPTDPAGYTAYRQQWVSWALNTIYTTPNLTITPLSGTFSSNQSVTITSDKSYSTIYYTLDGTTPSTSSSVYTTPLTISSNTTLKTFGADQAGNISDTTTITYTFPTPTPSSSSPSSSNSIPNQNHPSGWKNEIHFGPNYMGNQTFKTGDIKTKGASIFIPKSATFIDVLTDIQALSSGTLINTNLAPFPWMQKYNIVSEFFQFSATSSFNGYPVTSFVKPIIITLPYKKTHGITKKQLQIIYYNTQKKKWQSVNAPFVIDEKKMTISTTTNFLSVFAVGYKK